MFLGVKKFFLYFYNITWDVYMWLRECCLLTLQKQPLIMSVEMTLTYIIENKCSVARYGDGEMKFIKGEATSFQYFDIDLQMRLSKILHDGNKKLLICIPGVFGSLDVYADDFRLYWKSYLLRNRHCWYKYIDKNYVYGEAFISRCYLTYKDRTSAFTYFNLWKKVWKDKDVIIVEGEKTRLGVGNDLFDEVKSIKRILAPNINAFAYYKRLIYEIQQYDTNYLVLLALGPTATVLAADLSKEGYQAIDIGHIDVEYEWMKMGAKSRVAIQGKFVNEAIGGRVVGVCTDKNYLSQIVKVIN